MSTNAPLIFITYLFPSLSSLFISVWMNAFGISNVAVSLCSFASTANVINNPVVLTVGLDDSSLFIHTLCTLPLATVLAFTSPDFFSTRNNSDSNALFLSVVVKVSILIGLKHTLSCSCFISLYAAWVPFSPNFITPFFKLYVSMNDMPISLPSRLTSFM